MSVRNMATMLGRKMRASMGMRIHAKSWSERWLGWMQRKPDEDGAASGARRESAGPARRLRMAGGNFRQKTGIQAEMGNPMEPEYYKRLPQWLRAEGMYAPMEIGKIIFYLLIPIFAIVGLGSRNLGFIQRLIDYTGEYHLKAYNLTHAEQAASWKKVDEQGIKSHYSDNIAVQGSTLANKRYEERVAAYKAANEKAEEHKDAPAEYFRIMADLREEQIKAGQIRGIIGDEAKEIMRESGAFVRAPGQREMFPSS
eukprot:TRINITY_DN13564_c0_g1_i1.p1 TRINITY_DN13564_c0_g1~~TRINITY_DN13564_c0_g1_i1.p1  ORF type:complete len:255 (+),score=42.73 TRINITY_DN13564_c0_g1_i1:51-815(+)